MLKKNILQRLSELIYRLRYHVSIETLPIDSWFKIHESGDLKLLVRNDAYFKITFFLAIVPLIYLSVWVAAGWILLGLLIKDKPDKAWEMVYNEFIKRIGLSKEYTNYLEKTRMIARMQCDWIIEPSPIKKAELNLELMKLKDEHKNKTIEYNQIIAQVSRAQGFRIDAKVVSTLEFYSYLKANTSNV